MGKVDFKKVLENPEFLEKEAERFGGDEKLYKKERQLREMFATVLKSKDLSMVIPRLKYQAARHGELKELAEYVEGLVKEVRRKEGEEFERYRESLLNFLEAVVAYARYYESQKKKGYSRR